MTAPPGAEDVVGHSETASMKPGCHLGRVSAPLWDHTKTALKANNETIETERYMGDVCSDCPIIHTLS